MVGKSLFLLVAACADYREKDGSGMKRPKRNFCTALFYWHLIGMFQDFRVTNEPTVDSVIILLNKLKNKNALLPIIVKVLLPRINHS